MKRFTNKQECLDWLAENFDSYGDAINAFNDKVWTGPITLLQLDGLFKNKHTDLDSKQQLEQRVVESFGTEIKKEREDLFKITDEHEALRVANKIIKINQEQPTFKADSLKVNGCEVYDHLISEMEKREGEIKETIANRTANYGEFEINSKIMQDMKDAAKSGSSWDKMSSYQKEAVEMILHKIGRIVCGDPDYIDSWHDIAGYAKLVEDILDSAKRAVELNDVEVE